jgi:glycosyltransferase involved in cell wall biosynthesis
MSTPSIAIKPLRIIHSEAATNFGGQEFRIFKEMVAMRDQGHHMEAICQPDALLTQRLIEAGFVVHTMYMDGFFNIVSGIFKIWRILLQGRFDVLNTHSRQDTIIAATAGRLAGTSLIVRTRHLSSKVNSLLSYIWLPHCVTTVSDYVRNRLIEKGVSPNRVETIYSPLVLADRVEHSSLRGELGLKETDTIVGCVAVMRPNKGHPELIDAMVPLMRTRDNLHLVIVGGGSPVYEQVEAYVQQLGMQSRIHLLGIRRDIANLMSGFDVFALATKEEASGTVFLEAASCGVPIVSNNVGGVPEVVARDQNCLLVELGDSEGFKNCLARLIDDPALRIKFGEFGLKLTGPEGKFSVNTLVKRTEAVYRSWISELN